MAKQCTLPFYTPLIGNFINVIQYVFHSTCAFQPGRGPFYDGVRESSMGPDVSKHRHHYCPHVIDFSYYTTVVVVVVV